MGIWREGRGRETKQRDKSFICWFTPEVVSSFRVGQGRSQVLGTKFHMVAAAQALGPSSAPFPDTLAGMLGWKQSSKESKC